jgi:hypothetical protein
VGQASRLKVSRCAANTAQDHPIHLPEQSIHRYEEPKHGPLGDSASMFDKPSLRCDHDVAIDWSIEKGKTDIIPISNVHPAQLRHQRPSPPQTATRFPGCRSPPRYVTHSNSMQHAACSSNAYRRRPKTCKTLLLIKHSPSCQH